MTRIRLYYKNDILWRFKVAGHSDYAESGADIVCASVSVLVINTLNSIEKFTKENFSVDKMNQSQGIIDCSFPNRKAGQSLDDCTLLLNSMILGLYAIEEMYGEYIIINKINND